MKQTTFIEIGQRFGRLVVLSQETPGPVRRTKWRCRCDCGEEHSALGCNLVEGYTKSCGCWHKEGAGQRLRTHGRSKVSPIYGIWAGIQKRCMNPKDGAFKDYGGRGIKRCERWADFAAFEADMLPTYVPGLTLERKEVNGDYCPENCCWIPMGHQSKNSTRTQWVQTPEGKLCAKDAVRKYGTVDYYCAINRIRRGWDPWKAITDPPGALGPTVVKVTTPDGVMALAPALKKFGTVRYTVASVRIGDGWDPWKAITTPFPKPKE